MGGAGFCAETGEDMEGRKAGEGAEAGENEFIYT